MRRVVVTGLGLVTPLGGDLKTTWEGIIESKSGVGLIDTFDTTEYPAKIAGLVKEGDSALGLFNPDEWMTSKDRRKVDRFILYGVAAADQAIKDSGWQPTEEEDLEQTGVMIGAGIGGLSNTYDTSIILHEQGPRRVSPFFIPSCLINLAAGNVSIKHGFKGPNHATVTACSSGAHAIGDASRLIQFGDANVMIAGGAEAAVCPVGVAGFSAARTLSTNFNDQPHLASRPWDRDRDGFVMGEGAGMMVLEEYEHAKKRGAKIYAELTGYGLSGDAYHVTSPPADGNGAYRAMRSALKHARLNPEDIGYINAHGTSTPVGDTIEVRAIKTMFKDHAYNLAVSSTKSAIGHLLGAAGGVESIFAVLALNSGILPPTLNLDNPDEGCDLNFVPKIAQEKILNHVLSNSFGFGGTNSSLIFSKVS